jgi:hypothetical protein
MRLTNLQQLCLEEVRLTCAAVLPAMAALTALTKLSLSTEFDVQPVLGIAEVELLTALTGLKHLDTGAVFDEEAVCNMWDDECRRWRQQQP